MKDFGLIADGDKILIGLSGGKDSLLLTELLGERMKIYKPRFSLIAAHIKLKNIAYNSDEQYLRDFCGRYDIPFIYRELSFESKEDTKQKSPCFICSWTRRKELFRIAEEENCNKIALGHHQDDILETLLMNLTFQGAFGSMPPLLKMNKFDMTIIRPMALITEKESSIVAEERAYRKQNRLCPYESDSHRFDMKNLLLELEAKNPHVRQSLWNSMMNVQQDYLPQRLK